jgi:uncharacterized protein YkwD
MRIFAAMTVLAFLTLTFASTGLRAGAQTNADGSAVQTAMSQDEKAAAAELFQSANRERTSRNLPPLREDPKLVSAAWLHAKRMAAAGTLSHQLPGEPDLIERIRQAGVHSSMVAENVAEGSRAAQIHRKWMHSAPHRANLLDPRANAIGIAVVERRGKLFAVEDFARELAALSPAQQERAVASLITARGLQVEKDDAVARAACNGPVHTRPLPMLIIRYSATDLSGLPAQAARAIESRQYRRAAVGACGVTTSAKGFSVYRMTILLY